LTDPLIDVSPIAVVGRRGSPGIDCAQPDSDCPHDEPRTGGKTVSDYRMHVSEIRFLRIANTF